MLAGEGPSATSGRPLAVTHFTRADVASRDSVKLLDLERSPWRMRQAPSGGTVVLWKEREPGLEIVALESPARRSFEPAVGRIEEVHWLHDGRTFAVNGKLDGNLVGALVDVASGEVRERSPSYGPFSPCGETFLAEREGRLQLIERSTRRGG